MTSKRSPGRGSELDRAGDPDNPSTLRSIEAADVVSAEPEGPALPLYYEPQPLVPATDHKTIEVETIRLAEDIDPRKLPTELRLARPHFVAPDSGWPQADVVVVSSQPPLAARRRWRTPVLLLVLLVAIVLLVLAHGASQRAHAGVQTASAELPTRASAPALEAANPPSPTPPVTPGISELAAPEVTPMPIPPTAATALAPHSEKHTYLGQGSAKSKLHSIDPAPNASSQTLTAASANKPKRAIY